MQKIKCAKCAKLVIEQFDWCVSYADKGFSCKCGQKGLYWINPKYKKDLK